MLFFKCRDEGEECEVGFNFYRLSDKANDGFIFYCTKFKFIVRFSRITKKLHVNFKLKPAPPLKPSDHL